MVGLHGMTAARIPRSSSIEMTRRPGSNVTTTCARPPCACLSELVSASWTMRYADSSRPGSRRRRSPSTDSSTGSPANRTCVTRSSRRSRPGIGSCVSASPRTPSIRRMSASASRPVVAIDWSADRASSGRVAIAAQATSRLDHHHAHVVGDHVVQLPGNSLAFLEHCPRVRSSRSRSTSRARSTRFSAYSWRMRAASPTSHATNRIRSVWIRLCRASGPPLADEQHGHDRGRQCREPERCRSVEALADGVGRDEDPQPDLSAPLRRDDGDVDDRRGEHDEHHDQRIAAAPHERKAFEEQQRDRQRAGGRHVRRTP